LYFSFIIFLIFIENICFSHKQTIHRYYLAREKEDWAVCICYFVKENQREDLYKKSIGFMTIMKGHGNVLLVSKKVKNVVGLDK